MTAFGVGPADYGANARRTGGILADRELDALLARFAVVVGRAVDRVDPWPRYRDTDSASFKVFAERAGVAFPRRGTAMGPPRATGGHVPTVEFLTGEIRKDRRRYESETAGWSWASVCDGPMIRRQGTCGQRATQHSYITNVSDGTITALHACSRHADWLRDAFRANYQARQATTVPEPYANAGGRLAVHLPEIDWTSIYAWALGREYTWPPERSAPATAPSLTLIAGERGEKPAPPRPRPLSPADLRTAVTGARRHLSAVDGEEPAT